MKKALKMLLCFVLSTFIILLVSHVNAEEVQGGQVKQESLLSLPGENWALGCILSGYEIDHMKISKDGRKFELLASNPATLVTISIFLTKENLTGDSKKCRDYYWNRLKADPPSKMEGITMRELGNMALLEYSVKDYMNIPVNMKHVNAYLAQGDTWIDIHLSKGLFKPEDQKLFDEFLANVRINEAYQATFKDNFFFGMEFINSHEYEKACIYLDKALATEKKERQVIGGNKRLWRILVEKTGLVYLATGKLSESRETFEYGIANDAEYTPFYYGLAYVYAKSDDMEKTLDNLKLAYKYKESLLQYDRKFPNPKTYSGFNKFFANEKFSKEIEQMLK